MGSLESQLHHRALRVPLSTRLSFQTPPTSLSDLPTALSSAPANAAFIELRCWLEEKLEELKMQTVPIGHKNADKMCSKNIERIELHLQRLQDILSWSWDHAKAIAGVPGYYPPQPGEKEWTLVQPRK